MTKTKRAECAIHLARTLCSNQSCGSIGRVALDQFKRLFLKSLCESFRDLHPPARPLACLSRRPLMRVGSKVLRWNLDGKTREIRRRRRRRRAVLQSPIPSFRSCALVTTRSSSFLPKCRGGDGRRRTTDDGGDNRPEIWFSPPLSPLSLSLSCNAFSCD